MFPLPEQCSCPYQDQGASIVNSPVCSGLLLFMAILETYINSQCNISQPCERVSSGVKDLREEYDFIVVGGGSAGSIVAGRLAANTKFKVLLIEAGGPDPVTSRVPSFYRNFWNNPETDWMYRTVPDNFCLSEKGRGCTWPRGKALGGSSIINGMMYHRGHAADFSDWADFGAKGWSWLENLPFYDKTEDNRQIGSVVQGLYHASGGPLPVQHFRYTPEVAFDFLLAVHESGFPVIADMVNPNTPDGLTIAQTFNKDGQRYTTARAYLEPKRSNLDVLLRAQVTRVLINNKLAYGVEYVINGTKKTARARKEVILSAGALNSPHILMHSGIGPRDTLKKYNIPEVTNLPVGQNLRNHYGMTLYYRMDKQNNTEILDWSVMLKYLWKREGPMTATGLTQITGLLYSSLADQTRKQPDLQFFFNGYYAECSRTGEVGEPVSDVPNETRPISINAVLLRPRSVGNLTLQSNNPLDPPLFYANYFQHSDDLIMLVDAARYLRRIISTPSLQAKYGVKLDPAYNQACERNGTVYSIQWLECMARVYTDPQNHQQGTAAIGSVIDDRLRVFNVTGLRVIDASAMPTQITGNPQGAIMMVAERGAYMIQNDWKNEDI